MKEYIKMCLALDPEFFENWELKDGDRVYLLKDTDDYTNSEEYGLYTIFDRLLAHEGVNDTENWHYATWMIVDGLIRPIPSQKRLLELYTEKHNTANESHSMIFFANWLEDKVKEDHGFCLFNETAEEMMLIWIMETCFCKKWNGEAWV